jgi:hypothetical protein
MIDSTAFRRWFGKSKVVDADGKPLRVYTGTFADFSVFGRERSAGATRLGSWFDAGTVIPNAFAGGKQSKVSGGNIIPVYLSLQSPKEYRSDPLTRDEFETLQMLRFANYHGVENGEDYPETAVEQHIRANAKALRLRPAPLRDLRAREQAVFAYLRQRGWRDAYEKMLRDLLPEAVTPEGRPQWVDSEVADHARERLAQRYDGVVLHSTLTDWGTRKNIHWDHPDAYRVREKGDEIKHFGSDWYLALDPRQIKSATGNVGTFDPNDADIRHNPKTARRNPTTPLPATFAPTEPGLLTVDAFIDLRNPGGKYHHSDAYDFDLRKLNPQLKYVGERPQQRFDEPVFTLQRGLKDTDFAVFNADDKLIGVLHDGTLYEDYHHPVPQDHYRIDRNKYINLPVKRVEAVKYPERYLPLILDAKAYNHAKFPLVLQRFSRKGEAFELRAEAPPRRNHLDTLAILNADGLVVAKGMNEWGATLLVTAREYRSKGLGKVLADVWYDYNPESVSGGFTYAGEANARATWAKRVREFLARGWYAELVKQGRLTATQVRRITDGLGRMKREESPLPRPKEAEAAPPPPVVYVDEDNVGFVVYDPRFLVEQDEKYLLGYGFFREASGVGTFLYRIEHEPAYRELATRVALQLARENKDKIYVGGKPADKVEWQGISGVKQTKGYLTTTRAVLPDLRQRVTVERLLRKKFDRYDEIKYRLLEMVESKWQ